MTSASFQVEVTYEDAIAFAKLSGDWNPLHTDPEHAANTAFRQPVLHGAFSAGLLSRLAGMYLPGTDCLLHNLRLRFVAPIIPPVKLVVSGEIISENSGLGRVEAKISDADSGTRYVDGVYEFSRHDILENQATSSSVSDSIALEESDAPILVVGATGGLGRAVLSCLGPRAIGIARRPEKGMIHVPDLAHIKEVIGEKPISGIVHCAWPPLDNERLIDLVNIDSAIEHNLASPLRHMLSLAQYMSEYGVDNAMLVLVGSTAALPGRHNYRMPIYSLAKTLVPELARILATELGPANKRCVSITYDVIDGGMNKRLSPSARVAHADRAPTGILPSTEDAATQIAWLFENSSFLVSGANISFTGSAAP